MGYRFKAEARVSGAPSDHAGNRAQSRSLILSIASFPDASERISIMNNVAKVIEVVGTSEESLEDAIRGAIARASKTVENLQWFEVREVRGALDGANIERFQVMLKIGFGLNDD